jgi:hypothetical protein
MNRIIALRGVTLARVASASGRNEGYTHKLWPDLLKKVVARNEHRKRACSLSRHAYCVAFCSCVVVPTRKCPCGARHAGGFSLTKVANIGDVNGSRRNSFTLCGLEGEGSGRGRRFQSRLEAAVSRRSTQHAHPEKCAVEDSLLARGTTCPITRKLSWRLTP